MVLRERRDKFFANPPPTAAAFLAWCDKYRWWLGGFVLLLYLAGFNGLWRPGADAALYLTVGRNIAEGLGYSHWDGYHQNFSPGIAYLIAAAFRIGGAHGMMVLHGMLLAAAFITLALNFTLMRLVTGRAVSVAATVLLAVNTCFYSRTYLVLTEIPFQMGMMASLLGFELLWRGRRRVLGTGLLIVGVIVMASFRSVYAVVVAGMVMTAVAVGVRRFGIVRIATVVVAGAIGLIVLRTLDPSLASPFSLSVDERIIFDRLVHWWPQTLRVAATTNLWELLAVSAAEAGFGVDFGPILNIPLSLAVLAAGLALFRVHRLWGVLMALFVFQWLAFIVTVRYYVTILPFLTLGWLLAACWAERRVGSKHGRLVFICLMVLWIAPNLIRTLDITIEQRRPNLLDHYRGGKYAQIDAMAERVRALTPRDAVVLSELRATESLCYLSHRRGLRLTRAPWESIAELPLYVIYGFGGDPSAIIEDKGWQLDELIASIPIDRDDSEEVLMLWSLARREPWGDMDPETDSQ